MWVVFHNPSFNECISVTPVPLLVERLRARQQPPPSCPSEPCADRDEH